LTAAAASLSQSEFLSMIAAVIAFLAYCASTKSASEGTRSTDAAVRSVQATEDAVEGQRNVNALARERDRREEEERETARGEAGWSMPPSVGRDGPVGFGRNLHHHLAQTELLSRKIDN
jgi:hypothetical protein